MLRHLRRPCDLLRHERDAVDLDLADDQVSPDGRPRRPGLREEGLVDAVHPGEISEVDDPDAVADDVLEAAVVAMPSEEWGETPVAFVVMKAGASVDAPGLKAWTNERVGKFQRLNDVVLVDVLPRSAIGKVLKRELRDRKLAADLSV